MYKIFRRTNKRNNLLIFIFNVEAQLQHYYCFFNYYFLFILHVIQCNTVLCMSILYHCFLLCYALASTHQITTICYYVTAQPTRIVFWNIPMATHWYYFKALSYTCMLPMIWCFKYGIWHVLKLLLYFKDLKAQNHAWVYML